MAEFLIKARIDTNPDPEKDRKLVKRGDVVTVKEDGFVWGKKDCPPIFYIIKVPGMTVDNARKFLKHWREPVVHEKRNFPKWQHDQGEHLFEFDSEPTITGQRTIKVLINAKKSKAQDARVLSVFDNPLAVITKSEFTQGDVEMVQLEGDMTFYDLSGQKSKLHRRKLYTVEVDNMSQADLDELDTIGHKTMNWGQFKQFLKDKKTGEYAK